ncbi:hypothetical protein GOBAR_AA34448 [Gossypium barbadense]|uniref:Rad21/Rec8-like protein N-terminal domain-containing protein n=1 Tax=Gossypium barbadense TaxID=3634 RepID=A0A2P5W582_GOSBA|nr:hypothetical protein GOBAR_AA34448 [Gossypium barbadense]
MFYSQFILAKKGPLGTIWIAAHLERKLRKNQVADTDIGVSVDSILFPEVPIALRLSSHLLLGVVRIYSRKVNYLFDDCSEALLKIKQAFRSTAVDLPPEELTAPYHSITLPETFDLDDFELPDNEIFQGNYFDNHISSREQITLQDTMGNVVYSTSQFGFDERFGEGDTSQIGLLDEELVLDRVAVPGSVEVSEYDLQGSDVPQKASNLEAVPMVCSGDQDEDLAANSEFVENDQDVGTPGLMELPNLSGDHKVLADHMESEHHILTELGNECVENASNKSNSLDGDTGPVDQYLHNDVDHDAVPPKNGCQFGDMEKEQTKPPGSSVHDALSVEYTSAVGTFFIASVGRSSVFKMKPTPPLEVASMKRARSAPRSSTIKRKVLMDDTMVLHGDTIREQLVNTEDIRHIRKKAPCTRPEISLIQRKFLEDEIFSEPIFTGISGDLACLHSKPYDLSSVRISEGEEFHASSELAKNLECSVRPSIGEAGIEGSSVPVIHGSDEQTQSAAIPSQADTQQGEYSDLNAQQDRYAVDDVPQFLQHEPLDGITEMEIDKDNVEVATLANCSVLNELGLSSRADLDTGGTSNKTAEEVTNTTDGSMLNIATCLPPDQKMTTQPGEDASELDLRNDKGTNPTEVLEHNVESIIAAETESKAADELLEESKANTSVEVSVADCSEPIENGYDSLASVHTSKFVNGAQNAYETRYGKIDVADEAQVEGSFLDNEHNDSIFKGSEESKLDSTYSEKVDMALKNASLIDGETPIFLEVDAVNEEMISLADNRAEYEDVAVANDTEFLNVDDNELGGDEDDDGMPCGDESRLVENSGWSSRTRAVAKYLQNLFEDEVIHGHKVLSMDSLLARKTQKEASRMFFETLVLKTRDYIHVEQGKPFDNIYIMPRAKLMKSDF